jgi:hypothetical protein
MRCPETYHKLIFLENRHLPQSLLRQEMVRFLLQQLILLGRQSSCELENLS